MTTSYDCLALIPARGGSKGILRKNIAPVAGRPLIAWTIAAARNASSVSRIVVTTDDPAIANVSRGFGAETPFLRPAELAGDAASGAAPALHALRWLEEHERYRPKYFVLLQPTSPLRTSDDIDAAMELLRRRRAQSAVSVTPVAHPPHWTKKIGAGDRLTDYFPNLSAPACRQELPAAYALNGAIYLIESETFLARESWNAEHACAYVMPEERSLDIDSPWQLRIAEFLLQERARHAAA